LRIQVDTNSQTKAENGERDALRALRACAARTRGSKSRCSYSTLNRFKEKNPTVLQCRRNKIVKIITIMVPSEEPSRIKPLLVLLKWGLSRKSNTSALVICTVNSLLTDISLKRAPSLARALVLAFIYSWVSPQGEVLLISYPGLPRPRKRDKTEWDLGTRLTFFVSDHGLATRAPRTSTTLKRKINDKSPYRITY